MLQGVPLAYLMHCLVFLCVYISSRTSVLSLTFRLVVPGVLGLHLLHDLFAEAAHLGGALDRHVLRALIPKSQIINFLL